MDEFELFENVDLKEMSKKTRISEKDLESIKLENFENISKTKGLGFIKIIEREYGVDLSSKKEKLVEFLRERDRLTSKEFFIAPPPSKKGYSKYFAISLLIILFIGGVFAYLYNRNYTDQNSGYDKNPIVKEATKISGIDINDTDIDENGSTEYSENNKTSLLVSSIKSSYLNSDTNESDDIKEEFNTSKTIDKNITQINSEIVQKAHEDILKQNDTNQTDK
ncbi:MAG: hypothetical protein GXO12_02815, partial [Epsilonproteobacteria bacterium]|nr:hypothetical protein [Campylobacterota bacterium]